MMRSGLLGLLAALAVFSPPASAAVDIEHWKTSNGAGVYFVATDALPIIDIQVDFAAGSAFDPPGKAALAGLTRRLLDTGAGGLDEDAIADRLADLGAQLGGGTDEDRASVSLRTLSYPSERDAALELLATILHRPSFPRGVLEREKKRSIADLEESLTRPETIASRRFSQAIYGAHPYGTQASAESIAAIVRDDVEEFYRRHYAAPRASIAIVGDLARTQAELLAERLAVGLPAGGEVAAIPPVAMPEAASIRVAHPSAQAHVMIGMPGITRDDPDYHPLLIGNYVLGGGGFVSRLVKEVREKRGYAYSAYSYFAPQQQAGPFMIGLQTKGSQVADALAVVDATLAQFLEQGPTEAELQAAKDNTIKGFGLRLDSNRKVLGYVSVIGFYGLPLDWLAQYPREVARLEVAQVRDAFQRRIRPQQLVRVVVGGEGDPAPAAEAGPARR